MKLFARGAGARGIARVITLVALAATGAVLLATPVWWHARYNVTLERLKDNFYLFEASGMNVAALVTDEGVVLVDTMPHGWWGPALLNKIRAVTDQPITTIINTHSHQDHIGNTGVLSTTVTDVLVHENTQRQIEQSDLSADIKLPFLSASTFSDRLSLMRGKHRIDLHYFGPGHTNGDTWVVFPSLGIMHIGDLAYKNDAPSFDRKAGGSGVAYPDTLAKGLAATSGVDYHHRRPQLRRQLPAADDTAGTRTAPASWRPAAVCRPRCHADGSKRVRGCGSHQRHRGL